MTAADDAMVAPADTPLSMLRFGGISNHVPIICVVLAETLEGKKIRTFLFDFTIGFCRSCTQVYCGSKQVFSLLFYSNILSSQNTIEEILRRSFFLRSNVGKSRVVDKVLILF